MDFQVGKGVTHRPVGCGGFIYMHHHFKSHDLVTSYTFSFLFLPNPLAFPIERAMRNKTRTIGVWRLMLRLWISQKTVFYAQFKHSNASGF